MILQDYYNDFKRVKRNVFNSFNEYVGDNISDFFDEFEWEIISHMEVKYDVDYRNIFLHSATEPFDEDYLEELTDVIKKFIDENKYSIGDMEEYEFLREWEKYLELEELIVIF